MGCLGHTLRCWIEVRVDQQLFVHLPNDLEEREYILQSNHLTRLLIQQEVRGVIYTVFWPYEIETSIPTWTYEKEALLPTLVVGKGTSNFESPLSS